MARHWRLFFKERTVLRILFKMLAAAKEVLAFAELLRTGFEKNRQTKHISKTAFLALF